MRSRSSAASALTSSPGASRLTSGSSSSRLRRSVSTASAMPGYWTLTATLAPVVRDRAVDLADRRGGERLLLELREGVVERRPSSSSISVSTRSNGSGGTSSRSEASVCLELLALGLGDRREVDGREHLPDLHRRAAHLAELLDELAGERGGALAGRGVGALGRAHAVGRARAGPAQALARDQAAEAAGAGEAGGGGGVGHF